MMILSQISILMILMMSKQAHLMIGQMISALLHLMPRGTFTRLVL